MIMELYFFFKKKNWISSFYFLKNRTLMMIWKNTWEYFDLSILYKEQIGLIFRRILLALIYLINHQ